MPLSILRANFKKNDCSNACACQKSSQPLYGGRPADHCIGSTVAAAAAPSLPEEAPGAQFSEPLIFHLRLPQQLAYKHNLPPMMMIIGSVTKTYSAPTQSDRLGGVQCCETQLIYCHIIHLAYFQDNTVLLGISVSADKFKWQSKQTPF